MFSISHKIIMCTTLALVTACSCAIAFATEGERTITLQDDVSQTELIKLTISAGDVEIVGTTGNNLTAVVTAVCQQENRESCYQMLKELAWSKKTGTVTELGLAPEGITRYDHVTMKVKLGVPTTKKLDVNLSAGELRIDGTSGCLNAEVNAGGIKINLKENQLGSAELHAKVGDVKLVTAKGEMIEGDRSLLVGASLKWKKGTGTCHVKANVLAGEVQLVLNP